MASLATVGAGPSAGGFSPLSIANCVLWLRANTISGLSDGDSVATWSDESGQSNDVTEATNKPTYKTGILNSLPVVRFDGSNDQLITAGNVLSANDADFTIYFVIANYTVAATSRPVVIGYNVTSAQTELCAYNFDNGTTHSIRYEGANRTFSQADTDPSLIAFMRDNPYTQAVVARFNGAEVLSVVAGSTDNTLGNSKIALGVSKTNLNTFWYACDLAEVIVYEALLGSGDIALVETYLNDKWSVY